MTITQAIYAVKIAKTKSMNKAAAELYVSQPALSGAIRELEEEIGSEIFIRFNRGVSVTSEGEEFLSYARQMVEIYEMMEDRFLHRKENKKKFSVSMQHYSFAVDAFIELGRRFSMNEYELAIHETKTFEVIENVKNHKSELGILYVNDFNEKALKKIFSENELEFLPLFDCGVCVYISASHPLASQNEIAFDELRDYPCLSFEQGEKNSFYFAEEVLSTLEYRQIIKANDRATMLNLMTGMNGYTLCSGIIIGDLNDGNYVSIPLKSDDVMTIGYIKRKNMPLSRMGEEYVGILKTHYGNTQNL